LCMFLPVATSGVDCSTESPGTCMDQSVLLQHHAKITIEDQKKEAGDTDSKPSNFVQKVQMEQEHQANDEANDELLEAEEEKLQVTEKATDEQLEEAEEEAEDEDEDEDEDEEERGDEEQLEEAEDEEEKPKKRSLLTARAEVGSGAVGTGCRKQKRCRCRPDQASCAWRRRTPGCFWHGRCSTRFWAHSPILMQVP